MDGRHVHREQNFAISYISMNKLTSSKILWINCGVILKYSRHFAETVCKVLSKSSPHLSQCFGCTPLSLQVGVKLQIVPPDCELHSWNHVPSGNCSPQCAPSLSWTQNGDSALPLSLPFTSAHCALSEVPSEVRKSWG